MARPYVPWVAEPAPTPWTPPHRQPAAPAAAPAAAPPALQQGAADRDDFTGARGRRLAVSLAPRAPAPRAEQPPSALVPTVPTVVRLDRQHGLSRDGGRLGRDLRHLPVATDRAGDEVALSHCRREYCREVPGERQAARATKSTKMPGMPRSLAARHP